ncbi:MAG TPA: class I SAM-dependent methyltransferase [Chloroflexota bacterium]|nr:class I SAM-dependent methyltransferase [Chloroflexota bacterium]
MSQNEWSSPDHARSYLGRADNLPHRGEGEATLLELMPSEARRILDLGTGDGRLLALVLRDRPQAQGVALDFSPTMLEAARARFAGDARISVVAHDLDQPLPEIGRFDAVVSSFVIHHLTDERKRSLYAEIFALIEPGGLFCNLEHVASPTAAVHAAFLRATGKTPADEDRSNLLLDAETQIAWLRDIGFVDVDCFWKWREYALLAGSKPGTPDTH